ncbi:acylphosphatase [Candidatus Acetothermia bacterium]|nr:acylphosphatase [Candidatus Acetothermia bacterium]MBI3643379.1 acylphosphatase [Candidatus Acetothermia bacterium]
MKRQCRVRISGRVQGVSFRASTHRQASEWVLTGYVKNLKDGRVEALFQGEAESLEKMVDWCYKGPRLARVEHVDVEWMLIEKQLDSFRILMD